MTELYPPLEGFIFSGCAVYARDILMFWGQKAPTDDPLDASPAGIFLHYPKDAPGEQWAHSLIGESAGIRGAAVRQPSGGCVSVLDDGAVYFIGGGVDDYEENIPAGKNAHFTNVKSVRGGAALAVGTGRKVYRRDQASQWTSLGEGLPAPREGGGSDALGFRDIDGFDEADLYACGGEADLWHHDGKAWTQVTVAGTPGLRNVRCASDGQVYITTTTREVLVGRGASWTVLRQEATRDVLESIVELDERVLVSAGSTIFEVAGGTLRPAALGAQPPMRSRAHLAAGDGVLLVAGADEAAVYDGSGWTVIR